jgi:hypothetical protein
MASARGDVAQNDRNDFGVGAVIAYDEAALGVVSQMPEQDVKACELNKAEEVLNVVLPSRGDTAEVMHPGEEPFHFPPPTVTTQLPSILQSHMDNQKVLQSLLISPQTAPTRRGNRSLLSYSPWR